MPAVNANVASPRTDGRTRLRLDAGGTVLESGVQKDFALELALDWNALSRGVEPSRPVAVLGPDPEWSQRAGVDAQ